MTPGRDDRVGDGDGTTTITSRARPDAEPKGEEDPAEGGRGSDDDDDDDDADDEDGGALEFIVVRLIVGAAAACGRGGEIRSYGAEEWIIGKMRNVVALGSCCSSWSDLPGGLNEGRSQKLLDFQRGEERPL